MVEILKAVLFGIVEGITEWLPISSTGHMILLNAFMPLRVSERFWDMFLVVIQLGAILAVVLLFWKKIWPFAMRGSIPAEGSGGGEAWAIGPVAVKVPVIKNWCKVAAACLPAVLFVLLGLDDVCDKYFYNPLCVSIALIAFGVAFILVERRNAGRAAKAERMEDVTFSMAAAIGVFQLIAAAFPGTSRSGATIVGALLIGVSRTAASEFTFILAIPVMLGASLLKVLDFGLSLSGQEWAILLSGMASAFVVSIFSIRFLLGYIKKHDFSAFGWYRIALGAVVLVALVIF